MRKTVILGKIDWNSTGRKNYTATVEIRLEDGRLSLVGNVYHTATLSFRCCGAGFPEWLGPYFRNDARFLRLCAIAQEWHLNDMQAGSPAQMAYLKEHPVTAVYPESHYDKASEALRAAGLNPDPSYMHEGKPYAYGSAWLKKELPPELVAELEAM